MAGKRHRLVSIRKVAGFSQERLAETVGVERTTVMRWEHGETRPQPWARPKLARALGISDHALSELLGEPAEPDGSSAPDLGVEARRVNEWKAGQADLTPLPYMHDVLETALAWASDDAGARFAAATRADVSEHQATRRSAPPAHDVMLPIVIDGRLALVPFDAHAVVAGGLDELANSGAAGSSALAGVS